MRLALVENKRTPPSPGLSGSCPACGKPMLAKCGNQRVHHWAHRGRRVCDRWWEPETEWHRSWKNKFPLPWQEIIRFDASGEKHIADVHTDHGLTAEFQYSHLNATERATRENFYGNMVWVVYGGRLARDLPRFVDGRRLFRCISKGVYVTPFPERAFPANWLNCAALVFFDFASAPGLAEPMMHVSCPLWGLLPGRIFGLAVVLQISREAFVSLVHRKTQILPARAIVENVRQAIVAAVEVRDMHMARQRAFEMPSRRRRRWRTFRGRKPF